MIEDVECNEGDEVRFKAVYTGDPSPEITWTVNGIPITESEKIRWSTSPYFLFSLFDSG